MIDYVYLEAFSVYFQFWNFRSFIRVLDLLVVFFWDKNQGSSFILLYVCFLCPSPICWKGFLFSNIVLGVFVNNQVYVALILDLILDLI